MYHYNPREGTAAYSLPERIPDEVKGERLSRVIELQKQHSLERLRGRLGAEAEVLLEGISTKNADELRGSTEHEEAAVISASGLRPGDFVRVRLSSLRGKTFRAERVLERKQA
jgi:tRNA-2-methylthio-N6-dimethylallyladenosine synthase